MSAIRGRVVTPDTVIDEGVVAWEHGRITRVRPATVDDSGLPSAAWLLPGFVDIHVHGGGGHTFTTGDPDEARAAAAFHARHGTTTLLASLVAAPPDVLRKAVEAYRPLIDEGVLAGIHLEGPYLSERRCGAQNPAHLRVPNLVELSALLDLGGIRMVTIAPELPGALDAIALLVSRGVIAAVGHTDATYEQTLAAVTAGATAGTHVCNGMRPIHHREPGPIAALLVSPTVVCEQIPDGVHLHDGMFSLVTAAAGVDRVALVTDAMAAAGQPDGEYELGGQRVTVAGDVARLATPAGNPHEPGAIAGSTLTMDAAVRRTVHSGMMVTGAARMAATTPARLLGHEKDLGSVSPGQRANIVALDENMQVNAVYRDGVRIFG